MGIRRTTIGMLYAPNSNWIAGAYYVQNIIMALAKCDKKDLPIIKVISDSESSYIELKKITAYPYLEYYPLYKEHSKLFNLIRRIVKKITKYNLYIPGTCGEPWSRLMFVYPCNTIGCVRDVKKALAWIPDFQEKYLSSLFTNEELIQRQKNQEELIKYRVPIVFSSNDARADFYKFHPNVNNIKTHVLQFAVTHPDFSKEDISQIRQKYGITKSYLFCANQFWSHKNHLFLFKAFKKAKALGLDLQLVCSGKMYDYRNDSYQKQIVDYISSEGLQNDIIITGFIERTEQLCLMKNAYALVQPSLFEGWSTVVEDAKCLNKFIYLSDLNVHKEQAPLNASYFDPRDEDDLVNKLLEVAPTSENYDYNKDVIRFGKAFLDIVKSY